MKRWIATVTLGLCAQAFGHGSASNVAGEWMPIVGASISPDVKAQLQSSPLGQEILLEYRGDGVLEVLAEDGKPFVRISGDGVEANFDHPAWYTTTVAGPRPLPPQATDGVITDDWRQVSSKNYWGWFDKRLEKADDHHNEWQVGVRVNGELAAVSGTFKELAPPAKRKLVTLDRNAKPIADLTAMIVPDVEPAIRVSYAGDHHMVILDEDEQPMLRFGPDGVAANVASKGWQSLGREPLRSESQWVTLSHQPAYTWPDARLQAGEGSESWQIPVYCHADKVVKNIQGGWLEVVANTGH